MVHAHKLAASPIAGMSVLVVEPDPAERAFCMATLRSAGLEPAAIDRFTDARTSIDELPPAVLVTEARLEAYNGLHLALVGRSIKRNLAVVVTSTHHDPVIQRGVEQLGGAFVVKPLTATQLLTAVYRTLLYQPNADGTIAPLPSRWAEDRYCPLSMAANRGERRRQARRRSMATFLCLESLRRRT